MVPEARLQIARELPQGSAAMPTTRAPAFKRCMQTRRQEGREKTLSSRESWAPTTRQLLLLTVLAAGRCGVKAGPGMAMSVAEAGTTASGRQTCASEPAIVPRGTRRPPAALRHCHI
jgi:hypothetical protein